MIQLFKNKPPDKNKEGLKVIINRPEDGGECENIIIICLADFSV